MTDLSTIKTPREKREARKAKKEAAIAAARVDAARVEPVCRREYTGYVEFRGVVDRYAKAAALWLLVKRMGHSVVAASAALGFTRVAYRTLARVNAQRGCVTGFASFLDGLEKKVAATP